MRFQAFHFAALAILLCEITPVSAVPVTYTYEGPHYNKLASSHHLNPYDPYPEYTYTTSERLTIQLTIEGGLLPGTSTYLNADTTVSWFASDGEFTFGGVGPVGYLTPDAFSPGNLAGVLGAQFELDAAGNVTQWSVSLFNGAHASQAYTSSGAYPYPVSAFPDTTTVTDFVYSRPGTDGAEELPIRWAGVASPETGTWTTEGAHKVPESDSLVTFVLGFATIWMMRRYSRAE